MLTAIQQGQRLDWWRSGVFNGLFWSGAFFILCALIRRLRGPNPLVALPYLWKWNTVLLGSLLFWFRFTLTLTIILIPQSLAIHGFEADQIGPAIIWSAVPLLLVAFTAGLLLLRGLDPRLLFAAGLTCTAFRGCAERPVHECMGGGKLLSHRTAHRRRTIVFSHRAGGLHYPAGNLHGGVVETAVDPDLLCVLSYHSFIWRHSRAPCTWATFSPTREKLHSNLLGLHVTQGSWITDGNLHAMAAGLYAKSSGLPARQAPVLSI